MNSRGRAGSQPSNTRTHGQNKGMDTNSSSTLSASRSQLTGVGAGTGVGRGAGVGVAGSRRPLGPSLQRLFDDGDFAVRPRPRSNVNWPFLAWRITMRGAANLLRERRSALMAATLAIAHEKRR